MPRLSVILLYSSVVWLSLAIRISWPPTFRFSLGIKFVINCVFPKFMFKPTSLQTASDLSNHSFNLLSVIRTRKWESISPSIQISLVLQSNCLKQCSRTAVNSLGNNVSPCLIPLSTFIHFVSLCNLIVMIYPYIITNSLLFLFLSTSWTFKSIIQSWVNIFISVYSSRLSGFWLNPSVYRLFLNLIWI